MIQGTQNAVSPQFEPSVSESLSLITLQIAAIHKKPCIINSYPSRPHVAL